MKQGQFYGAVGTDGYSAAYMQIYNDLAEQYRKAGLSQERMNMELERLAARAETEGNRILRDARNIQQKAAKEGRPSAGVVSQLVMAKIKALGLAENIKVKAAEAKTDAEKAEAEAVQRVYDKYDYSTYGASGASNVSFRRALITADENTDPQNVIPMIGNALDTISGEIQNYSDAEITKKRVHLAGAKAQLLDQLSSKGLTDPQYATAIDNAILQKYGETPEDISFRELDVARAAELAEIPTTSAATSDVKKQLLETVNFIDTQIATLGQDSPDVRKAERLFYRNKALTDYMDAQDRLNYAVDADTLESIAQANNTTSERILKDYDTAKQLADSNPALVPEEYLDNVTTGVIRERQRAAQLRARQQQVPTAAPDLEQLAAQRFLAATPTPRRMYTQEQRQDLRRGIVPQQVGTDVQQTNRAIQSMLRQSEDYKTWYNSLTKGEQVMQQYTTLSDKYLQEIQSDAKPSVSKRAQKIAEQLFEPISGNPSGEYLSADALVSRTAEAFKDRDLQDEARAYYTALVMNQRASTQPELETQQANVEPVQQVVEEDMDFTFMDRLRGRKAERKYQRTNKPISMPVEQALQPQAQAEQSAQLAAMYQDPNALDDVNLQALPNRPPTDVERIVYGEPTMTEAPTALPLSELEAIEIAYPQGVLDKYLIGTKR